MAAPGHPPLAVELDLPPGWLELPAPGERPQGLLRRSPYEKLARRLVSEGAVIKPLAGPTAAYLERVAAADPEVLGLAVFIEVPSREHHTFITFVVFPGLPAAGLDLEDLAARRGDSRESQHTVEAVDLAWASAARAAYTRPRADGPGEHPFVQYWLHPHRTGQLIIALGDVDAPPEAPVDAYISDIDRLVRTMRVTGS